MRGQVRLTREALAGVREWVGYAEEGLEGIEARLEEPPRWRTTSTKAIILRNTITALAVVMLLVLLHLVTGHSMSGHILHIVHLEPHHTGT